MVESKLVPLQIKLLPFANLLQDKKKSGLIDTSPKRLPLVSPLGQAGLKNHKSVPAVHDVNSY